MSADPYPRWRYHRTLPACIVRTPEDDAALGPGWEDSPAAFLNPPPEPKPEKWLPNRTCRACGKVGHMQSSCHSTIDEMRAYRKQRLAAAAAKKEE